MDYLDNRITADKHGAIAKDLEKQQHKINDQINDLTASNVDFRTTASYLLGLARKAKTLYECSNDDERQ